MSELEAILQANKRQRVQVEKSSTEESTVLYAPNIQQKADCSMKWCERVFSSYLPCSAFSYEVTFPKDCLAPFDVKHQVFPYSVRDFHSDRVFSCLVIKTVKIYISAVIKPGDIVLKVNETNLCGTADEPLGFDEMKTHLATAKENSYVVRFLRVGATSTNFLPSPSEITLFQGDKNTAAKFAVVRDGSKPIEDDAMGATKGKPATPLIQLVFLDSTLPVSIKKMMQGTKVSWEHHPVFINNVSLTLSNSSQTNMQFVPLPSSQYTASVMPPMHGVTPYHCFTGQHVTPLGNLHAPLKGPTSASAETAAAAAAAAGKQSDTSKNGKTESSAASADSQPPQQQQQPAVTLFAGVFKDRNKWCAVMEVPNRFEAVSDGYHVTSPVTTKQIFLGRFDHVEEARYVYKKMDSDFKTNGTFSSKRLARTLRSSGFTSIASNLNSASAASHAMTLSGAVGTGLDANGKPILGSTTGMLNKPLGVGATGGMVGANSLYKYQPSSAAGAVNKAPLMGTGAAPPGQQQQRVGGSGYPINGGVSAAAPVGQWGANTSGGVSMGYKPMNQPQQQSVGGVGGGITGVSGPPTMKGGMSVQQQPNLSRPAGQMNQQQPQQMSAQGYKQQPLNNQQQMMQPMQQQQQYLPPPPMQQQMPQGGYSYASSGGAGTSQQYSSYGFAPVQSYYHTNDAPSSSGGSVGSGVMPANASSMGGMGGQPMSGGADGYGYSTMGFNSTYAPPSGGMYANAPNNSSSAYGPSGGIYQQSVPGYSSALSAAGMNYLPPNNYAPMPGMANNSSTSKSTVKQQPLQQQQQQQPMLQQPPMNGAPIAQSKSGRR